MNPAFTLYEMHLVIATIKRAALDARQNRDPVMGAEAELWLRSGSGALFLDAVGVEQEWAIRRLGLKN